MKKMVYFVQAQNHNGDSWGDCFESHFTFSREEAIAAAKLDRRYLTRRERENCAHSVCGYLIEVADGMTAEAAYDEALDNDEIHDPDDAIEITIPEDF